jgi:3-(3-hydroxy-phenyl)propionate hydroxylase
VSTAKRLPILVVGAGPAGLTAALALRARQLPVLVVEAQPETRLRPGSRAIFIHRESLEILESVVPGLGFRIAQRGLVHRARRTVYAGRTIYRRSYPSVTSERLPHASNLSQASTELILLEACRAAGVEFAFETAVTQVHSSSTGALLMTDSGLELSAPYVVAADGARSATRAALGIEMEGSASAIPFVIVDVAVDSSAMANERVFHYEHPAVGKRNVLIVPFADGCRVDLQCRERDDVAQLGSESGVRGWLSKVIEPRLAERVTWISRYRFKQLVATRLTDLHQRVLLIGDAAHLFAPFGARGMNSGIADAASAARAIAASLDDPTSSSLAIHHFAADRRAAAQFNRAAAEAALRHMQARDPVTQIKRRIAAALSPWSRRAGEWLDRAPYGPRTGRAKGFGSY